LAWKKTFTALAVIVKEHEVEFVLLKMGALKMHDMKLHDLHARREMQTHFLCC